MADLLVSFAWAARCSGMSASSSLSRASVPAQQKAALPAYLLTRAQGEAARVLLSYVVRLPLSSTDSRLLAAVVGIRAARGGTGNLTGVDLRSLRLTDAPHAVAQLRELGWSFGGDLFAADTEAVVPVTVPELTADADLDRPLVFGKLARSRVSGWITRTLAAKPVRKTSPAARLAALFLAAHSSPTLAGDLPAALPSDCRDALPELIAKGFITEVNEPHYQLDDTMRHLSGMAPWCLHQEANQQDHDHAAHTTRRASSVAQPEFDPAAWQDWKQRATPALLRHVEAVEQCAHCALPTEQVADAFSKPSHPAFIPKSARVAYGAWKDSHPDRGPQAAEFTVAFRAQHGHGPSYTQLCNGMGWNLPRMARTFVVQRLVTNQWLTTTGTVPWTLRPGATANDAGIALPLPPQSRSNPPRPPSTRL
ncbi:hypothetical protein ACOKM5_43505 [Streptomyces sp. BH097]|uniref:hypothetical protein n=1 Tax=unclassified Streptomyces TaxID=2593676 RepID=UPI003BB7A4A0